MGDSSINGDDEFDIDFDDENDDSKDEFDIDFGDDNYNAPTANNQISDNPFLNELFDIMMARFEHLVERGFLNPSFLTNIRNDPSEVLRFIRQNRAVVGDQLNKRLHPDFRPTRETLERKGIMKRREDAEPIEFNLQELKLVWKKEKYIVFGYIRNIQKLLKQYINIYNHYMHIPEIIFWHILHYYHYIQLQHKRRKTIDSMSEDMEIENKYDEDVDIQVDDESMEQISSLQVQLENEYIYTYIYII